MAPRKKKSLTGKREQTQKNAIRKSSRNNPEINQRELNRDNQTRRIRRLNSLLVQEEAARDTITRRTRRSDPTYLLNENERDNASKSSRRSNIDFSQQEATRDTRSRNVRRSDSHFTQQEAARDTTSRRTRRSDPIFVQQEADRDTTSRRTRRSDPIFVQQEADRDTTSRRTCRSDLVFAQQEADRDTTSRQTHRTDPIFVQQEAGHDTTSRRTRRLDPVFSQQEATRDTSTRHVRRSDVEYARQEVARDTISRRTKRNEPREWLQVIEEYERNIRDGPFNRCYSCDKLWFSKQVKPRTRQQLIEKNCSEVYLNNLIIEEMRNESDLIFCTTCLSYIRKQKFPRFNINNSMLKFPTIPEEFSNLNLTSLEERCIAARLPFMKICALGCDRQLGIKSGVVNVPIDVRKTIESIPARLEDSGVIQLSLMRKMEYKNAYMTERVRPGAIWKGAKLLCETPLYIEENIKLDHRFEAEDMEIPEETLSDSSNSHANDATGSVDKNIEDTNYIPEETMIVDANEAIRFAPEFL
ncbi:hypothetical protein PVAND_010546 [Polypedilum vanderplanki]|uniref:DUF6570 domain-containing protein n=1 Tax=Polypedilum vanderplanki TaxID=319348 RepID=A0A9J6CGW8_POLVA|nr:hypothetical protein PVAND_010546 [Polypedilum vanderplanki]